MKRDYSMLGSFLVDEKKIADSAVDQFLSKKYLGIQTGTLIQIFLISGSMLFIGSLIKRFSK